MGIMGSVLPQCQASSRLALGVEPVLVSDALLQDRCEVELLPGCSVDVLRMGNSFYVMKISWVFIVCPNYFFQIDPLAAVCVFYPVIPVYSFADVLK